MAGIVKEYIPGFLKVTPSKGDNVGNCDGDIVDTVGLLEGAIDGTLLGNAVGNVGTTDGDMVGYLEGALEGSIEGFLLGVSVGVSVGLLGINVGDWVGRRVGISVATVEALSRDGSMHGGGRHVVSRCVVTGFAWLFLHLMRCRSVAVTNRAGRAV